MGNDLIRTTRIDPETGEIINQKSFFYYDGFNEKGYKYRNKAVKVTVFPDCIPTTLSKEAFLLLYMITEIANDENVLVYRITRKSKFSTIIYKPMDKLDVMERIRFKYGKNKFDKYWNELKKHCIKKVQYHECNAWVINPAIINKCRQIPPWLYDEFDIYLNPYIPKTAIKKYQSLLKE